MKVEIGIERYKDKVILCLGDSITSDYSDDDSSWCQMIKDTLPVREVKNYGIAGTTVAHFGGRTDSFIERCNQMQPYGDVVLVFGGINDFNHSVPIGEFQSEDTETFYGALNELCIYLINHYPNADLVFATPMHAFGFKDYPHWNTHNEQNLALADYVNAIKKTCGYYSIPVIDLYSNSGMTPDIKLVKDMYLPDGLHPNKEGRKRLARKIMNYLVYQL